MENLNSSDQRAEAKESWVFFGHICVFLNISHMIENEEL